MDKIGIIGAGAWGTALATVVHRAGRKTQIWAREPEVAMAINTKHENFAFLPGVILEPEIGATTNLAEMGKADAIILATPAQYLRDTCKALGPHLDVSIPIIICAKGIELGSGALMNEVVENVLPMHNYAVLSGPTFAAEVAMEKPAAVTLASRVSKIRDSLAGSLGTPCFRIYKSIDVIGAEIGGAVKNVIAIASGIVEGRGFGDSARAAIIT